MARVLVTEAIADNGLQRLRDAGHEVDIQLDWTPESLLDLVKGAHALIIRSATQVTAEVLLKLLPLAAGMGLHTLGQVRAACQRSPLARGTRCLCFGATTTASA